MAKSLNSMSDPAFLEAALEGLQLQKERIENQIREVARLLGRHRGRKPASDIEAGPGLGTPIKKRELSDAARRKIAAAQKKRWAEYRKRDRAVKTE